jgi:predicted acylesterase/phospholipase RssA
MSNGDLLIDGAVLNSFPVDVMLERLGGKGNIIGVNVSRIPEQFNYYDFGTTLSGWEVLLSRLNPFAETIRIPRMVETLLRSTDIKGIERLNIARQSLQVLVEPNVRSIALMDFKSYEKISELGYEEAKEVFIRHGICSTEGCVIPDSGNGAHHGLETDPSVNVSAVTPIPGH